MSSYSNKVVPSFYSWNYKGTQLTLINEYITLHKPSETTLNLVMVTNDSSRQQRISKLKTYMLKAVKGVEIKKNIPYVEKFKAWYFGHQ